MSVRITYLDPVKPPVVFPTYDNFGGSSVQVDRYELLQQWLPELAVYLISTGELPEESKTKFINDPDGVDNHQPRWHQWGVISHSLKFREFLDDTVPDLLAIWGVRDMVGRAFSELIDGVPKRDLLRMGAVLHDIGKFRKTAKGFEAHEAKGQELILNDQIVRQKLIGLNLTEAQIKYLAYLSGKHFEFGFLRNAAKLHPLGYTMAFINSEAFDDAVMEKLPEWKSLNMLVEVGILFLSDSLAKTDVIINGNTDEEIESQKSWAESEVTRRSLNPGLIEAILQRPVNVAIAQKYLQLLKRIDPTL